jgi:hypothetical protein
MTVDQMWGLAGIYSGLLLLFIYLAVLIHKK